MSIIHTLRIETQNGTRKVPVFEIGDLDVAEVIRTQTPDGIGVISHAPFSDASFPEIRVDMPGGLGQRALHDKTSVFDDVYGGLEDLTANANATSGRDGSLDQITVDSTSNLGTIMVGELTTANLDYPLGKFVYNFILSEDLNNNVLRFKYEQTYPNFVNNWHFATNPLGNEWTEDSTDITFSHNTSNGNRSAGCVQITSTGGNQGDGDIEQEVTGLQTSNPSVETDVTAYHLDNNPLLNAGTVFLQAYGSVDGIPDAPGNKIGEVELPVGDTSWTQHSISDENHRYDDSSGNEIHLDWQEQDLGSGQDQNPPALATSADSKYGEGLDFTFRRQRLKAPATTDLDGSGDISITLSFQFDDFSNEGDNAEKTLLAGFSSNGTQFHIALRYSEPDDEFKYVYEHDGFVFSTGDDPGVQPGTHTLTLRRDDSAQNVVGKLNGTTAFDEDYTAVNESPPPGGSNTTIDFGGFEGDSNSYIEGEIYEARYWTKEVSQSTLDTIADPSATGSGNFEQTAEGTESGLWFFEGESAIPVESEKIFVRVEVDDTSGTNGFDRFVDEVRVEEIGTQERSTADRSGNSHTLTEQGSIVKATSDYRKIKVGHDLGGVGETDYLENSDNGVWDNSGDGAFTAAVDLEFPTNGDPDTIVDMVERNGNASSMNLRVAGSGEVLYNDNGGTGVASSTQLSSGVHTFTIRRVDNGDGTNDITIKVFDDEGNLVLDMLPSEFSELNDRGQPSISSDSQIRLGARNDGSGNPQDSLEGKFYEARSWNSTIPSQSTLDTIADLTARGESNFEYRAEGNETGLWFMEKAIVPETTLSTLTNQTYQVEKMTFEGFTNNDNLSARGYNASSTSDASATVDNSAPLNGSLHGRLSVNSSGLGSEEDASATASFEQNPGTGTVTARMNTGVGSDSTARFEVTDTSDSQFVQFIARPDGTLDIEVESSNVGTVSSANLPSGYYVVKVDMQTTTQIDVSVEETGGTSLFSSTEALNTSTEIGGYGMNVHRDSGTSGTNLFVDDIEVTPSPFEQDITNQNIEISESDRLLSWIEYDDSGGDSVSAPFVESIGYRGVQQS